MELPAQFSLPLPGDSVILVVDDVPQNIQVVGTMLREAGYSIMPAVSGPAALQRVQKKRPDLILLDLMMPEMDGLEVCRSLRADAGTRQIPIIFLTASNEMEHLVQGLQAGAVDYVTKPFNPPELLARVRTHLELKHSRDVIVRYSQALRALNDEKNEFLGIAAHDLRNPLGAVRGYAELLLEEPGMSRAEQEQLFLRIQDASARMAEMVQNLLDANRIERGEMKLNLGRIDLVSLLASVIEGQRSRARAKDQAISFGHGEVPVTALADSSVAVQVFENLLSNAIKYSPPGKAITVRLRGEAGSVRCEVQDEGPGLSAEDQKRLFGKFARLSAKPTGGEQATGLGLSIVKRMVEAMNGKVWCESEPGKGAVFCVTLPA
jgi:two-component system, sensor histidine kinase and response regulator